MTGIMEVKRGDNGFKILICLLYAKSLNFFHLQCLEFPFTWFQVWIDLLKEMVLRLSKVQILKSFQALCSKDAEQDFFNNIVHMQVSTLYSSSIMDEGRCFSVYWLVNSWHILFGLEYSYRYNVSSIDHCSYQFTYKILIMYRTLPLIWNCRPYYTCSKICFFIVTLYL